MELRTCIVEFVEEGNSYREAAERFRVSPGFVNDMVRPSGEPARSRPERMAGKPDTTLDEPTAALREEIPIEVHRSPVGRLPHRLGPSHKKRRQGRRAGA